MGFHFMSCIHYGSVYISNVPRLTKARQDAVESRRKLFPHYFVQFHSCKGSNDGLWVHNKYYLVFKPQDL